MGRWYRIGISMRGTVGKRQKATRRFEVYADNYEEAISKAKTRALHATKFELSTSDA
jgi:hypothetical protein